MVAGCPSSLLIFWSALSDHFVAAFPLPVTKTGSVIMVASQILSVVSEYGQYQLFRKA